MVPETKMTRQQQTTNHFLSVKLTLAFDSSELNKKCNNNVWKWFSRELIFNHYAASIWRLWVHKIRTLGEVHVYGPERLISMHVLLNYQMRVSLLSYICLEADEKSRAFSFKGALDLFTQSKVEFVWIWFYAHGWYNVANLIQSDWRTEIFYCEITGSIWWTHIWTCHCQLYCLMITAISIT